MRSTMHLSVQLTSIHVKAYAAGRLVPQGAAEIMAATAVRELQRLLSHAGTTQALLPRITRELVHESKETAFGDGGGCIATARTDTGCILGEQCHVRARAGEEA